MLLRLIPALLCGFAAVLLFRLTQHAFVYPGESARAISSHLEVHPFHPVMNPVWGWIVDGISLLGSERPTWARLNRFSGLCGGLSVFFVFLIASSIPHNRNSEEALELERQPKWLNTFCGLTAAGLLMVNISFWFASTRAYPLTFGLALLLGCVWLVIHHLRSTKVWPLYVAAPLWGLGMTEYTTFVLLLPLFVIACINGMYLAFERFRVWPLVKMGLLGLLGLSAAVFAARQLLQSPSAEWMFITDVPEAIKRVAAVQLKGLQNAIPKLGWLMLAITTVLPGVIVLVPKRVSQFGLLWTSVALHFICTVIAGLVLSSSFLAPWNLFGQAPLFIAPIAFTAIWAGYLAGYWVVIFRRVRRRTSRFEKSTRMLSRLMLPTSLALILFLAWYNRDRVNPPGDELFASFVQDVADDIEDKEFVLMGGGIEDVLRLELHQRGKSPILLQPGLGGADSYRRYLMTLFPHPRLRSLAQVSQGAVLLEWLQLDPENPGRFATLFHADLLLNAGLFPVPSGNVFVGEATPPDTSNILAVAKAHWASIPLDGMRRHAESGTPLSRFSTWRLNHLSKLANNTGVITHKAGDAAAASEAYHQAFAFNPGNLSALLNLANLHPPTEAEGSTNWLGKIEAELANRNGPPRNWALGHYYGYVHDPGFYMERGMAWALSGKPRVAAREMEKAIRLSKDTRDMRLQLAATYFKADSTRESVNTYRDLLREDPTDVRAIIGLARLAALEGDYDTAQALQAELQRLDLPNEQLMIERAALHILVGQNQVALQAFEDIVEEHPDHLQAWSSIAILSQAVGDEDLLRKAMRKLSGQENLPVNYLKLQSFLLASEGKYDEARLALNKVVREQPGDVEALEHLLRLDMRESRPRDTTGARVKSLLEADPENAFANYVLGIIQHMRKQNDLAVASFKTSLATERSRDTLNALAWSLHELGDDEEAQPLAEEAVQMDPSYAPSWNTLGNIYHELGDSQRGSLCLGRSLELSPGNPKYLHHLAIMYEALGKREEAIAVLEELMPKLVYLPSSIHRDIMDLKMRLEESPKNPTTTGIPVNPMAKPGSLHLVHGDDDFKVSESARELANKLCPPDQQTTGLVVIDGAVDRIDEIESVATQLIQGLFTVSLFGDTTTVFLRNASFLNPYKAPGKSAGAKEQVEGLLAKLKGGVPGNQLLISAPRLDKRSAFWKFFDQEGSIILHERPKKEYQIDKAASAQAGDWFREAGLNASSTIVQRFIQRAGSDTRQIRMEIDKLALFAGEGGTVTTEMVDDLVAPAREAILWDFTDAFGQAKLHEAVKLFHQLLGQRENPVGMLIQLTNRARDLLVFRECIDRGWLTGDRFVNSPDAEVLLSGMQPDPRTIHPFRIKNLAAQARNYKLSRLVKIRDLFLHTHERMIFGGVPHALLLEMALIRAIGPVSK